MVDWVDAFCWLEHRKILTSEQSGIAALRTFGVCSANRAGTPLEAHIHKGCLEIVFLVRGFQVYEVENRRFSLSGADIFVTYPDEAHSSGGCPEGNCRLIWMQIDLSEHMPFFGLDDPHADELRGALRRLPHLFAGEDSVNRALYEAFTALSSGDEMMREWARQTLVCCLYRVVVLARRPAARGPEKIESAVRYIQAHLTQPFTLEQVAAHCGMSLSWFKTCFQREVGTPPRDYINYCKVEQAQRLLEQGKGVTETAFTLGFAASDYFSVIFKKYTGKTPTQYRKECAERNKRLDRRAK